MISINCTNGVPVGMIPERWKRGTKPFVVVVVVVDVVFVDVVVVVEVLALERDG